MKRKKPAQPSAEQSALAVSARHKLLVVGLGASAGGIKALKEFFAAMPSDCGMAFVVILHLSAEHESSLAQILQSNTAMPVMQVTETVKVVPNHVYVIPPAKGLAMVDGVIKLTEPERIRGKRVPIDLFFRTLADAYGENGIAVVLSGTGSDGTLGLKRVKENGGIGIAQDPSDAEYDGMPRSAINTGLVDLILPIREMPERIIGLRDNGAKIRLPQAKDEIPRPKQGKETDALHEILTIVRMRTGHDFSSYKHTTVLRRIARRLQVHALEALPEYLDFLREHPAEAEILQRDFLITVTNFFRDKETFEVLEKEVIPKLFAGKTAADTVRVWSLGTATGEEAYSLAILLDEYAMHLTNAPNILIFASDINEQAIAAARECIYEETIAADVSPERLQRYFVKEVGGYRIRKEIREKVVFAPHNILRDPPFSKLDLIVCRNLLIYLNRETQGKVLGIFNYALRRDGFLFLGSSENAENASALFSVVDKKHRIYKARPVAHHQILLALPAPDKWNVKIPQLPVHTSEAAPISYGEIHYKLVEQFAPPSVLVNEENEIVHVSENAGRFLQVAGGAPTRDLLKLVHPLLKLDLQSALFEAKKGESFGESRHVRFLDGQETLVNITVRRVQAAESFYLVIFDEAKSEAAPAEVKQPSARTDAGHDATARMMQGLEAELQSSKKRLQATIEQNETSTEELRASNEEMQAMNEELRSTLEELETGKEELQSVNEELITVNHELKDKVDEVTRSNSDLQNLMFSTDIGTIFLDRALRIKRYTPRIADVFNIIPSDVGRPFEHLTHRLDYYDLPEDAGKVLRDLKPIKHEVHTTGNRTYIARLLPYRTLDDRIDGVVLTFVDVSELRKSEEDLRGSEERFSAIVKQTTAGMLQTDLDGKILFVNDRYCEITGYAREELLEMRMHDLTHEEELPHSLELFERTTKQGEPFILEKRYIRKDGSIVWVHNTVSAILDADGNPKYILAVTLDLSERKATEEKLHESEIRLRMVTDALPVLISYVDAERRYRFVNKTYNDWFGHTPEEIIGKPVREVLGEAAYDEILPAMDKVLSGEACQFEGWLPYKDGGSRFVSVHYVPDKDKSGTVNGFYALIEDLTERKRAEELLRESEEKFRTLSEAAPALIWFDDADSNCLYVNQQYLDFSGKTAKEIEGTGWHLILHPEDGEDYLADFLAAQRERRPFHHRVRAQRHDGARRWIESFAQPLFGADGAYLGHVGVSPDITDSVEAEEKLKETDRRKDEFLATLAHELRNPLAPIRTGLEIMRRRESKEVGTQARSVIERQIAQIIHLVNDLLDVARISRGKITLQLERVNLADILNMALETNRPLLEDAHHELVVALPPAPIYLEADATRLVQVVLNLLNNAVKYTEPGGTIQLSATTENKQAVIRIKDSGIGIPAAMLPRIFDIFTQVSPASKQMQSGLGIGLSLVKNLVELHGGTIEAFSEGVGSEFVVRLPLALEQQPAKKPLTNKAEVLGTPAQAKVLVVDDNLDAAEMMEIMLMMQGHEVLLAHDGASAVKIAIEQQPGVILLDIGLPDIDGYEVARQIRPKLPDILLIALSGWGQIEDRRQSQAAGFDYHLVKPADFEELQKLLEARRQRKSA